MLKISGLHYNAGQPLVDLHYTSSYVYHALFSRAFLKSL